MNIILLDPKQASSADRYQLDERQYEHLIKVVKVQVGDKLRVGILNGCLGDAKYLGENSQGQAEIEILQLNQAPPKALPLTLVLALPRPNMLKRTLLNISAMGVKKIILLNSAKVEKSYWQSPVLAPDNIDRILLEGLEQARDTQLPQWQKMTRFRPYVEDLLPLEMEGKIGLLAHPYQADSCPINLAQESVLAIGPEGGWNEFEVSKWKEAGFKSVHLGERILKVETAVPVLLSRLYPA
jgi:RsmE family RNA methyltransferase